jgi:hypothetical protein
MDGVLETEMMTEPHALFAIDYYRFQFFNDYADAVAEATPSAYHVDDTLPNYEKVRELLDQRFQAWKARRTEPGAEPKPGSENGTRARNAVQEGSGGKGDKPAP